MLHTHAPIHAAPLEPIPRPLDKLGIADQLLGFGNSPAADSIQDKLMPQLVLCGQVVGFPPLLTSPMAVSRAIVSD